MAIVKNDDILGKWYLNESVNLLQTEFDWYFDFTYTDANGNVYKVYNVYCGGEGGNVTEMYYLLEDDTELTAYITDQPPFGWNRFEYRYPNIISTPDAEAEQWIRENARKFSSLYTHENGQWVYKCEIV